VAHLIASETLESRRTNGDTIIIIIIIIIIITNENIKVMLSRKRCRGTLQDYNKGEIRHYIVLSNYALYKFTIHEVQ